MQSSPLCKQMTIDIEAINEEFQLKLALRVMFPKSLAFQFSLTVAELFD